MALEQGKVLPVKIEDEMKSSYIDYAMSVIVSRALPDVRDGLKPVHRRILYSMYDSGITADKPHKKSARVVGDVLGRYHPHGDASVYDALVRLAQDFSTRYPLVDGHGNFGSIDGDSAAAMRYTEVRLSRLAAELLRDIDKETVDFGPNYDDSLEEPQVLPARFPNLLVNGSSGIAVGMATNIPPHNLGEVIDAIVKMIDDPGVTLDELMKIIRGPDFPTGAMILGKEGIREAYRTGRGIIRQRAVARIETSDSGKALIIITEIPYMVNKARLIEKIADLVRDRKLEGISDLRDETDRRGLRIVIELKRDANAKVILNRLYRYTPLEQTFGINMLALVNGRPKVLGLREALGHYLDHQKTVITRRSRYELRKAEERAHILEGLKIALDNLDAVIALIRGSQDVDSARQGLMEKFSLSEKQAQAILDMRLQRLTALERDKIDAEYDELLSRIAELKAILADERLLLQVIRKEILEIRDRYADERRTSITAAPDELDEEDFIAEEDIVLTLTHRGYVKRLPLSSYRSQRRGGRGIIGTVTREEDFVEHLFTTTTHHYVLFFTNHGKAYRLKAHEIPEGSRQAKGTFINNLIQLGPGEQVTTIIPVRQFDEATLVMATRKGVIKRTALSEFDSARRGGLIAVTLDSGDELIEVKCARPEQEVILVTERGLSIRFRGDEIRTMGRTARGVTGIRLMEDDSVVGMVVPEEGTDLLIVTEGGYGKRTPISAFRLQSRAGKGVKCIRVTERNGKVVGAKAVSPESEVLLISAAGIVIREPVEQISRQGRDTQGVRLMRLNEDDRLVSMARVAEKEIDESVDM